MLRARIFLFIFILGEIEGPWAFAKKVRIEWKPIENAVRYELQIQDSTHVVVRKVLEESKWKGELQSGAYFYEIRAIDKINRPGKWSEPKALAVMPPPPEIQLPSDGSKVQLYDPNATTAFKWKEVPGVKKYIVELRKNDHLVFQQVVQSNHIEMKSLSEGKYKWNVNGIVEPAGRVPASLQNKKWETHGGDSTGEFKVQHDQLEAPKVVFPEGKVSPPEDNQIELHWKRVDGAEAYEVQFIKIKPGSLHGSVSRSMNRTLASNLAKRKHFLTRENSFTMRVSKEESYLWGVRALANINDKNIAEARGPESVAQFSIDRNAIFKGGTGYVAVSTMLAPYTYQVVSPSNNFQGTTQSASAVFRLSGEYWFLSQWGIGAGVDYAVFQIDNQSFNRQAFELNVKYRAKWDTRVNGWFFSPKFGMEGREYNQLLPVDPVNFNGQFTENNIYAWGLAAGFDIRKQLSRSFSIGIKTSYFVPVLLTGVPSGSEIKGNPSYRNFNTGIQALYWLNSKWGLGLGGFIDFRSISYSTPASSGQNEEIFMNGDYFFGSLVYLF